MPTKTTTSIYDLDVTKIRDMRDPEDWIAFRKNNPEVPLALLIKDIQKQAIVAYRKKVDDDQYI